MGRAKNDIYLRRTLNDVAVRKRTMAVDVSVVAVSVASLITIFALGAPFIVYVLASVIGIVALVTGTIWIADQTHEDKALAERLRWFAECQMGLRYPDYTTEYSLINAVMNCGGESSIPRLGVPLSADKNGNCLDCKERFTLIATDKLNEHIELTLKDVVAEVEQRQKDKMIARQEKRVKELSEQRQRQMKLDSSYQKGLVAAFDDPDKLTDLRRSKNTLDALREISSQGAEEEPAAPQRTATQWRSEFQGS